MENQVFVLALSGAGFILLGVIIRIALIPLLGRIEDAVELFLFASEERITELDTQIATDDTLLKDFLHAALEQIAPHVDSADDPAVKLLADALRRPEFIRVAAMLWKTTPEEITPATVAGILAPIADKLVRLTDDVVGNV